MNSITCIVYFFVLFYFSTQALVLEKDAGLLSLPFQKVKVKNTNTIKRSYYGATSIYNDNQIQYLVNIQVGTPPQNFIVIVDTGSPYFWIPGIGCPTSQCPHPTFNELNSSTFTNYDNDFDISYNKGYAKGFRGTDDVTLAGVLVSNQILGIAVDTQDTIQTGIDYDGTSANGILGLSYPDVDVFDTTGHISSIPFHMASEHILAKPIFSIYTNSLYEEGWSGVISLGGYNASQLVENHTIHYIPIQKDTGRLVYFLWQMSVDSVQVYDQRTNATLYHAINDGDVSPFMSIDTGTTFTYIYQGYVRSMLESMGLLDENHFDDKSGCYFIDCAYGKQDSRFQVQFKFKGYNNSVTQLNIPLRELVEPVDYIDINIATKCYFSVCSSDDDYNFIMGDSVLRSMYTIFDMEKNQVGFSPTLYTNSTITTTF